MKSFSAFLRFYRREHSKPGTRYAHVIGTSIALLSALCSAYTGRWWLLLAGIVFAYACAWSSHFAIQHNRPATFKYPLWSAAADLILWWEAVTWLKRRSLG